MIGLTSLPGQILQNVANVANVIPRIVQMLGSAGLAAAFSPLYAFGVQLQGFADSVTAGDPLGAVNAVLNIPAAMTNAFMSTAFAPYQNELINGLFGALVVGIPNIIAEAIKPPASPFARVAVESAPDQSVADVSSLSNTAISAIGGAGTITLSPATESPAAETPVEETPAAETPVEETPATETPVEETPAAETPVDETPVDIEPSVDEDDTAGSGNGATDLSGGNKATPGQTHSNTKGSDSDSADTDAPESPTEDESTPSGANSGAATGGGDSSGSTGSGSDSAGGSDSSGGSGSGGSDE
jgi:uncharacterized membrane protein YgcG